MSEDKSAYQETEVLDTHAQELLNFFVETATKQDIKGDALHEYLLSIANKLPDSPLRRAVAHKAAEITSKHIEDYNQKRQLDSSLFASAVTDLTKKREKTDEEIAKFVKERENFSAQLKAFFGSEVGQAFLRSRAGIPEPTSQSEWSAEFAKWLQSEAGSAFKRREENIQEKAA